MKKLTSIILAIALMFTVTACAPAPADTSSQSVSSNAPIDVSREQLLMSEIERLRIELDEAKTTLGEKEQAISELHDQLDSAEEFKDSYQDLINTYLLPSPARESYYQRTENLPEYEEGSLTLDQQIGSIHCRLGTEFTFERKYRLSYYGLSRLPLGRALNIVRGYTGNDIIEKMLPPLTESPARYVYTHNEPDTDMYRSEPIMHYYVWFILANKVSRDEMEQIVEMLSDKNHEVYATVRIGTKTYHGISPEELDFTHEYYELPNVDILYTFDAEIINEYYRYA